MTMQGTLGKLVLGAALVILVLYITESDEVRSESDGQKSGQNLTKPGIFTQIKEESIPIQIHVPESRIKWQKYNMRDVMKIMSAPMTARAPFATTRRDAIPKEAVIRTSLFDPSLAIARNIIDRYPEYIRIKEVKSLKELYDAKFCQVELENKSGKFTAGTEIKVNIRLFNGYNQPIKQGGDLFNIRLKHPDGKSEVAGYVTDKMDGTYTGHVMAFWAGNVSINISVTNTKEGIGLFTNYMKKYGSYKYTNATFVKNKTREMTQCSPSPVHINQTYGGVCNLTSENYNVSFYCGKPKAVPCGNWVSYGWDDSLYLDKKMETILKYKDSLLRKIPVTVIPSSKGSLDYPEPRVPCFALPRSHTWSSKIPSGFLYHWTYYNLLCRATVSYNVSEYRSCLRNRPVISIGDSTTREWFLRITAVMDLQVVQAISAVHAWQRYANAEDSALGLKMEWQPHEHPFHGTPGSNRKTVKSVSWRLDQIPANSSAIVIVHWYAHIARCCDHVALREHVRHAKAAIVRLLKRSPEVQVFVKGPHLITHHVAFKPYKYIGMWVQQVLYEEFKDIQDKVTYLDQWDMSVAHENVNIHPGALIKDISLNRLINFACKPH